MKSFALGDGELTKISEFHFGARLNGDINFKNHHLNTIIATNWTKTQTTEVNSDEWFVKSSNGSINMRQYKHIAINATNAPGGNVFLSLDTQPAANEIHQYKRYADNSHIDQELYDDEREKAASERDFFIFFTTKKTSNITLPTNSGIVDRYNWESYFGPFAGRAFIYGLDGTPHINKADFTTLQLVDGVGPVCAEKILNKRPFSNIEDAEQKTNIKRRILEQFKY